MLPEPPPWLTAQMKDPWAGEEAREFWNGVQQARTEAAAYRAAFANPEEARALKDLYPGGVSEARSASERARFLDEIDHAYFGGAGKPPEEITAARAQLAQRLLREDPAAFREMVEAGLKLLQTTESQSHGAKSVASAILDASQQPAHAQATSSSVVAQHLSRPGRDAMPLPGQGAPPTTSIVGAPLYPEQSRGNAAPQLGNPSASDAHVAAYAAFEKAANEDLERSVGGAIQRALTQALPVAQPFLAVRGGESAQARVPALQERLAQTIRAEVEKALQGDRQLGEQVAQILAARRFDGDARAQVVRVISERAQQLVPGAAKRVLHDWTQTTLAAHRGRTQQNDTAATRSEVTPPRSDIAPASSPDNSADTARSSRRVIPGEAKNPSSSSARGNRVDYRRLTDEQILDMS